MHNTVGGVEGEKGCMAPIPLQRSDILRGNKMVVVLEFEGKLR